MAKEALADYINNIVQLSEEQLQLALSYFKESSHSKFEHLVNEGTVGQYMNFVTKGCLRIYFLREGGQETTRHFAFENQFATGLASFITENPSLENIQVMEDSELLRISRKDFYYLLNVIPAWEKFYRFYLENAYINNLEIFHREVTKDAELRYKELLARSPEVVRRLSNKVVASYLNMSPETLSRMKSR
ncbi:cAMP-binding domain of CRP or a regulatory subunit of cAMP-dependent protein kinases [Pedobacter westerhofensis]|uniref:cAMP-binding domain of CRP or a regulatory subunit of cAMP-dependent protein kinases n=1 Tax=Pedobacter westerhofensis TaxID=425512 RepID=A0A521ATU6_9SPHI|nr:Crp/Fnr family transcriptional regulator [Pedobacter westerhofensis]SMO38253.1 cAMP-binding domain of CRP or a regulatory subunit of cAMP-dependent protein kinases [Pedobacter westerhofensis]